MGNFFQLSIYECDIILWGEVLGDDAGQAGQHAAAADASAAGAEAAGVAAGDLAEPDEIVGKTRRVRIDDGVRPVARHHPAMPAAGRDAAVVRLAGVDVAQIKVPNGSPEARLAVEVRNALIFGLTGGSGGRCV